MNSIKIGIWNRRFAIATLLIGVIVVSAAYSLIDLNRGFAVLTTPPPDIPGPHYVAAELKILGPQVNLAKIKSIMGGSYATDYSYVKWGVNPFYKVYADNTFQEVSYGNLVDILNGLSRDFQTENNLINTYNTMKSNGAIDPESQRGTTKFFGSIPGIVVAVNQLSQSPSTINVVTSYWYATAGILSTNEYVTWNIKLNQSLCLSVNDWYHTFINASGYSANCALWTLTGLSGGHLSTSFYFKDLQYFYTDIPSSVYKIYTILPTPGTGYVVKSLYPSSPKAGTTFAVNDTFDPPAANYANITDYYTNAFAWGGGQVTLIKFKIGVGQVASSTVSVTPVPEGMNMKFTILYTQASTVLQTIAGDEYVTMVYTLKAPTTASEYTLPAATIKYTIPTP